LKIVSIRSLSDRVDAVSQRATCQSVVFLIFFLIFFFNFFFKFYFKKIKNATCQVPVCDTWHCQCHVALQCHVSVSLLDVIVLISIWSPHMFFCFNLVT